MTPTVRTAVLVAVLSAGMVVLPVPLVALAIVATVVAAGVDGWFVRRQPEVRRRAPSVMARGVAAALVVDVEAAGAVRVRQPTPPDVVAEPAEADGRLDARLVAVRRGRHDLPPPAVRTTGPLGLGAWHHTRAGPTGEVLVYPDLPAARRLAVAFRQGRFREPGMRTRGPMGLGTEFESIRDYLPDDDIRQVNWQATQRTGRPMSNQYRVEQDRDVICVCDTGRLMAAPLGDRTRLDAAVDAASAVALVADEVGDRCGVIAFDATVRRHLRPRRSGGDGVVRAVFDLEPRSVDSDYELAFRTVGRAKRAFVVVLTDLLEESAARPLLEAMPVLARRHVVAVASAADTDLNELVTTPPETSHDVYAAAVALDVLDARARVATQLRALGATVVEAPPDGLAAACVRAYLQAKARARL